MGIWAPITNKAGIEDKSLPLENSFIRSNNFQSAFTAQKSIFDQPESTPSNFVTDKYKSRVLLSVDENDNHHYGPYLPSKNKYHSTVQQQSAAPGYTYSHTVEKYMNKNLNSGLFTNGNYSNELKRTITDEFSPSPYTQQPMIKRRRTNNHVGENFVVIEENNQEMDSVLNESKPVKIIRVERTVPAIGNDTLKLTRQTADQ